MDGLPGDFIYKIMKGPEGRLLAFTPEKTARFDGERFVELPEYENTHNLSLYYSAVRARFGKSGAPP